LITTFEKPANFHTNPYQLMVHILLEICRFGSDKHCRSQFVSLCLLPVTAVGAPIVLTFLVYTLNVHGDMASVHFVAQFKVELFF
jgi:hypothetical protein